LDDKAGSRAAAQVCRLRKKWLGAKDEAKRLRRTKAGGSTLISEADLQDFLQRSTYPKGASTTMTRASLNHKFKMGGGSMCKPALLHDRHVIRSLELAEVTNLRNQAEDFDRFRLMGKGSPVPTAKGDDDSFHRFNICGLKAASPGCSPCRVAPNVGGPRRDGEGLGRVSSHFLHPAKFVGRPRPAVPPGDELVLIVMTRWPSPCVPS
jgi:hypothetical protein